MVGPCGVSKKVLGGHWGCFPCPAMSHITAPLLELSYGWHLWRKTKNGVLPWTFLWLGLHLGRDHLLWICLWRVQRSSPSLQNCYTRSQDHHHISVERRKMALRGWRVSYSITFRSHSEFENKWNTDKLFTGMWQEWPLAQSPAESLFPSETHEDSLSWLRFSILVFWASPE